MMKQEYFVLVLAHSLRGRLRRIHIPHRAIGVVACLLVLGAFSMFGFVASYARMAWKVNNYNALRKEAEAMRYRYQNLQRKLSETDQQLATLEVYAREISVAYGIKQKLEGPANIASEGALVPSFPESIQDYNFLRSADLMALRHRAASRFEPLNARPAIWPVQGRLLSGFGNRLDPFSNEGDREFHKGVDIGAPTGTPVHAAADGIVVQAQPTSGGFGRLVVIDHGHGYASYYAHLSRVHVQAGQSVRTGDTIGAVGSTGRTTAPHLHYEVRVGGVPMNPYNYMKQGAIQASASAKKDFPF
jgi:murein DD-endopeptidase MepM/ murein hydrolase activator NlpD